MHRGGEPGRASLEERGLGEAAVTMDVGIDQKGAGERLGAGLLLRWGHAVVGSAGGDLTEPRPLGDARITAMDRRAPRRARHDPAPVA